MMVDRSKIAERAAAVALKANCCVLPLPTHVIVFVEWCSSAVLSLWFCLYVDVSLICMHAPLCCCNFAV